MSTSTVESTNRPRTALRLPAVAAKTGLSKTHIYRLIKQGKFPKFYKISERVSVIDESSVDAFLAEQFARSQS